jgi:hypothetical protein
MAGGQQHDLFRPWAPRRKAVYKVCSSVAFVGGAVPALLVALSIAPPTPTDVVASIIITPVLYLSVLASFWDAPGENRTWLEKTSEFSTVFLLMSGITELTWELPWVILEATGVMNGAGPDDHLLFTWWNYGSADTRYITGNSTVFAVEVTAVICGIAMLVAHRLTRRATTPRERLKGTWIALPAITGLLAVTIVYLVSEWHAGGDNIQGGAWNLYLKFWAMNTPWNVALVFLPAMLYRQIDYLYTCDRNGASTGETWRNPGARHSANELGFEDPDLRSEALGRR